ncbi:MAG: hypothetical protein ACE5HH_00290 [Candidatus Hydrothermarchaeales archaeon]
MPMRCESCGSEVAVYELYPRSYRLYIYLCRSCRKGFLAHHFDLNLEIYQMDEVMMKENGKIIFVTGLKAEPRVFDFEVGRDVDSVVVADKDIALGELALGEGYILAPYSEKAAKRLRRLLELSPDASIDKVTKRVEKAWEAAR